MVELWFGLLCFTLTVFAVLDGWNIGAGALHLIAGRTGSERREIIAAHRAVLELARGLAPGVRRHVPARLPRSHGHLVRRVLPRALARALVVHPARRVHRGRRPHPRQALAIVVGFRLRRVERAARRAVWRRARQRDPRRAARRERQVQHVALHRLRRAGPGGDPRLVHAVRRGVHDGAALGARRDLPPAQDHRPGAPAKRAPRAPAVDSRTRAVSCHLAAKPGSCGRHSTGRWSSGLSPGWRSRLSWLEPGRCSPGCAEQGSAAPLRDRAR